MFMMLLMQQDLSRILNQIKLHLETMRLMLLKTRMMRALMLLGMMDQRTMLSLIYKTLTHLIKT